LIKRTQYSTAGVNEEPSSISFVSISDGGGEFTVDPVDTRSFKMAKKNGLNIYD